MRLVGAGDGQKVAGNQRDERVLGSRLLRHYLLVSTTPWRRKTVVVVASYRVVVVVVVVFAVIHKQSLPRRRGR